ncbi:MAG: hypothetical protein GY714_10460 [Desulfobacterales bacterium]|nr:hypothetical protein [Desulfobacterales bacterium]
MAAPKKATQKKNNEKPEELKTTMDVAHPKLFPFEDFTINLPGWKAAALKQSNNWNEGKQISENEYKAAVARLDSRPMGGGISKG